MHWGIEYQTKQNSSQEKLADLLFQNGADIILGSHPHVLQPMETKTITLEDGSTKNCFVIYSLGNFMSGQTKENTRDSIILNLNITKKADGNAISIDSVSYIPIYMFKNSSLKNKKFKILDIENSISNYENNNSSISKSTYDTLNSELSKIKKILD